MAYLNVSPMITAFRTSPDDFEMKWGWLNHKPSRHRFHFEPNGEVLLHAACDCSQLAIDRTQRAELTVAFQDWVRSYWRPIEINREFASHFATPSGWRRVLHRLAERLDTIARSHHEPTDTKAAPLVPAE